MKVLEYIKDITSRRKMHMTLFDPADFGENGAELVKQAVRAGTDAIMVGGSTGVNSENLDYTVKSIKSITHLPVILFPTNSKTITPHADAIYYMSMLNSSRIEYIIGHQVMASLYVKKMGIEPIPMGYIIIEPGMTVGRVAGAVPVPRTDVKMAVSYALAAQYLGMSLVYLEAGSGAPSPVPGDMVEAVKSDVDIPVIVGGGIRSAADAEKVSQSGADIIVTGTIVESAGDVESALSEIINAINHNS